jgi:putative two-component system response regulator
MLWQERESWDVRFAKSAKEALELIASESPDAVVTDVFMEGATGFDLLSQIRADEDTASIPVIVVTGSREQGLKKEALGLGATDLLTKPVNREELIARLRNVLRLKEYQDQIKAHNAELEQRVEERTRQLSASRIEVILRLAKAAEFRDEETGNHVIRVGCYCRAIARTMGLDDEFVDRLFLASPLHDIGKIGIPDAVLLKPGKLTPDEWEIMKRHCEIGEQILRENSKVMSAFMEWGPDVASLRWIGGHPLMHMASSIAMTHHEKWDGSGYPRGLSGEEIPLESRIVAIADVFDALRSVRPYKPAFEEEKALEIIREGSGKHFDPRVVEAFLSCLDDIRAIESRFADLMAEEQAVAA